MSELKNLFCIPEEHKGKPEPNPLTIFAVRPRLLLLLIANYFLFWFNIELPATVNICMAGLYAVIIIICLSDVPEYILRLIKDIRHIATDTEKERLLDIFQSVKERGEAYSKMIDYDLNLYIVDSVSVNAFAVGRHTIAVTRGLMATMNDDEIEAIIAHEIGHIVNGDGQVSLLVSLASNVYFWAVMLIVKVLQVVATLLSENSFFGSLVGFIKSILELALTYLMTVLTVLVASTSRKEEYRADKVAFELGYAESLLSALYKLYEMEMSDKKNLLEKLQATHPKTAFRIEALENMCRA